MIRILQASTDAAVLETRALLLRRVFPDCQITSAMNITEVEAACSQSDFDLVILGQSLPDQEKWRLETTIQKHCKNARLLEMYKVAPVTKADMHWDTAGSPAEFESMLRKLVYRSRGA